MRQELLKYLNCPICFKSNLELSETAAAGQTIVEGRLVCEDCKSDFLISKGIVYLYEKLSDTAEKEKKSNEREMREYHELLNFRDENWLLNFPDVSKMGLDERTERINRLVSENTALSLKDIIKTNGNLILEIGAGNCWATARMAENNYCVALDILNLPPIGLEAGQVFIENKNIYFERVLADMLNLPFKDSVFDYVLISSSLHHSSDVKKTLSQINKLLKPGGKLILLNEPSRGLFGSEERRQVDLDVNGGLNEGRYTINQWKKLFNAGGFAAKIFLPRNLLKALRARGGAYKKISIIFEFPFFKQAVEFFLSGMILKIFDGYFNAILAKK